MSNSQICSNDWEGTGRYDSVLRSNTMLFMAVTWHLVSHICWMGEEQGYLTDTCMSSQDQYVVMVSYFFPDITQPSALWFQLKFKDAFFRKEMIKCQNKRNLYLKDLKEVYGLSIRRIERLTGIGRGIIQRA